jgi:hypothetical protein
VCDLYPAHPVAQPGASHRRLLHVSLWRGRRTSTRLAPTRGSPLLGARTAGRVCGTPEPEEASAISDGEPC